MELLRKVWSFARLPGGMGGTKGAPPQPEHTLYVIGDVHGRVDLLDQLIDRIHQDIAAHAPPEPAIVLVGDYIDRGDDSAAVLTRVIELHKAQTVPTICLFGNHEEMMLRFLDTPSYGPMWLRNGGLQTLASYGIGGITPASDKDTLTEAARQLREILGAEQERWLRNRDFTYQSGNVVVVHAALDPEREVDEQTEDAMLWGHAEFARRPRTDGICVVHGHTIVDQAEVLPGRIPVDTGAVFTGRLTAAVLVPDQEARFLQTGSGR
ncbi:MAG: metallophosphoesterase [Pseudomonadota bacterium]